jgi:diacylglycerol kinase family enzyme
MNAVHLGVGASATRAAGAFKSRLGRFAYPIGALSAGVRAGGWRLVVRVDGEPIAESFDRVLMVAVSNGPSIGGGIAQVHPEAALDDGLAEVVVSGAVNPLARVGYAVDLARGKHLGRSDVQVHRGRHVAVTGDPFLTVADGEIDGPMTHRTWTLKPGAWQLAVPRPTGSPPLEHTSNAET